jgi:uncharacterized protein YecE (DUF72 family)
VFAILEHHGAAYCVMSSTQLPCVLRLTAPFAYVRLREPGRHLHDGSCSDTDLIWWTERIREWAAQGADILAYFNDDGDANADRNARTLRGMLGS